MIERLHVRGFKSLQDTSVELSPLTVIFGPNAVGKSNLLEAMIALSRLATEHTVQEALRAPLRGRPLEMFSLPADGLAGQVNRDHADFSIEAVLRHAERDGRPELLQRYLVACSIRPDTGELRVLDECLQNLHAGGKPKGLARIGRDEAGGPLLVRRDRTGRSAIEPGPLNHTLVSNRQYGEASHASIARLRTELAAWRLHYLDPRDRMREDQPPAEVEDIGVLGESVAPFLNRLQHSPEHQPLFKGIQRAVRAVIPSIHSLEVVMDKQGLLDIEIEQDGRKLSSRVISEGTLRVIALCCIAVNPWHRSLVAFEEPENGVHPRRIEQIAALLVNMLRVPGRQVVVTTHSPTLVREIAQLAEGRTDVRLLTCHQDATGTGFELFDPTPILREHNIDRGFDDKGLRQSAIEAMATRGWLDG